MILHVAAPAPKVFISYTHDSPDHKERIGWLADRLRCDEVDVRIDQAVRDTPAEGWPKWMEDEITSADYILLVCTETYGARYRGEGDPADGRGSRWETSLIRDILYKDPASISRFVPLLPRNATTEDIPFPLRHRATHFQIDDYYWLLKHLTDEDTMRRAAWRREPGGDPESPREGVGSDGTAKFSASIRDAYRRIDERVEVLTHEQYGVISFLQGRSRALVSGNPGSGKTLVAAQKAILLAEAGVATLFVCHNLLLAHWVRELTHEAPVDVYDVEELVQRLATESPERTSTWTEYSQPRSDQIAIALQRLESYPRRIKPSSLTRGRTSPTSGGR
jgi:SEFIR domain